MTSIERRLVTLLSFALALSLSVPATAVAAGWGSAFSVSGTPGPETFAWESDVVVDAAGNATYVWVEEREGGSQTHTLLRSRIVRSDGTVGPIQTLDDVTDDDAGFYELEAGIDAAGQVSLAWTREVLVCPGFCTRESTIFTAELDADGELLDAPKTVADLPLGSDLSGTDYAVSPNGESALAVIQAPPLSEQEEDEGAVQEYQLDVWRISADGATVSKEPDLGTTPYGAQYLGLDMDPTGTAFVAWGTEVASDFWIEAALLSPGSEVVGGLTPEPLEEMGSIDAVIDAAGNGTVVYSARTEEPARVYFARLAADGTVSPPQPLSPPAVEFSQRWASADVAADGTVVAAWSGAEVDGRDVISSASVSPSGEAGTPHELLSGAAKADGPLVATMPSGETIVMVGLLAGSGEEPRREIVQRTVGPDGAPLGPLETLEATEGENELFPNALAVAAGGHAAAAWSLTRFEEDEPFPDELSAEARGAVRDATGPSLSLWVPPKALAGTEIVLAAQSEDVSPVSYDWSFGDGGNGTGAVTSHAFASPGRYTVSVTATDAAGNSTARSAEIEILPAGAGAGVGTPQSAGNPPPLPRVLPATKVLKKPPRRTKRRTAVIRFIASEADAGFECRIDGKSWRACRSPLRLGDLGVGRHKVLIRAVGTYGGVDPSPAVVRFRVVKPKRR